MITLRSRSISTSSRARLNKLADLGTSIVTISGGEPMMHPELDQIIHHIRVRGMIAGLISNGYYFTPERIKRLNKAGLEYLQISIDNVEPDEVSRKSLRVLDKKLRYLSEYADFHVNINSVIGGGIKNPDDALTVARRAVELGFSTTVGVIHDVDGTLKPLSPKEKDIFQQVKKLGNKDHARLNWFQDSIAEGKPYNWRCRAGAHSTTMSRSNGVSPNMAARRPRANRSSATTASAAFSLTGTPSSNARTRSRWPTRSRWLASHHDSTAAGAIAALMRTSPAAWRTPPSRPKRAGSQRR